MILRNPQFLWFLLALPLFVALWRWRRRRVVGAVLALRMLMLLLVVLALADPVLARPIQTSGALVVLVDQSDSLGADGQAALRAQAATLVRDSQNTAGTHVIFFGANVSAPTINVRPSAPSELHTENTDLAGALRAAHGLLQAGGGRVVLLSDGAQTRGDALGEARALARDGIAIDTLAYADPDQPELWVAKVEAPTTLRSQEKYQVTVTVGSTTATSAQVVLYNGDTQIAAEDEQLVPGQQTLDFETTAGDPGVVRLRAVITGQPDTFPRNNSAAATALVGPLPRVLLIEGSAGAAAPLRIGLRTAGIQTDVIEPQSLPSQLSALDAYEGAVLIDVPASDMTLDQMTTLREFVRSEGRGLVATGGRSSFTLGGYKDTPLETVLPVEMTPPPRPQRADVSLLLIIDRSSSMGPSEGQTKFNMAKEAAIQATESLRDDDRIGVLAFDTEQEWTVPFQQIGSGLSLNQIQQQIGTLGLGGGTDILAALQQGLPALEQQPTKVKHVVLLTDGRSFTSSPNPYRELIAAARAQNITLSAIAIGEDADTELLQNLAQWGAGRYHFAAQPDDIPRLTLLESEIARTEPQVEGQFRADQSAPHPLLREFRPNQIPQLDGYVATTIKPEAELVLKSPENDPVLAVWQYGLGRAVAWTPSIDAPWADNWSNWPQYGEFWAEIIRYTLPEPDSGPLQVRVSARGDETVISADSLLPGGTTLDLADTQANVTLVDGTQRRITLRQTAPGHYEQVVTLPADGPYAVEVRQLKENDLRAASVGYVQSYPAEYLPTTGGAELLKQISGATGGQVLAAVSGQQVATNDDRQAPTSLATWLLLAAVLVWPVELAVRRGWLRLR